MTTINRQAELAALAVTLRAGGGTPADADPVIALGVECFASPGAAACFEAFRVLYDEADAWGSMDVKRTITTRGVDTETAFRTVDDVARFKGQLQAATVYAAQLRDLAARRALLAAADNLARDGLGDGDPLKNQRIRSLSDALEGVLTGAQEDEAPSTVQEILAARAGKPRPAYLTGFEELDRLTGGWREGSLITIYGLSGKGKSSFALACLDNLHAAGVSCAYYSFEMPGGDVTDRLLARRSGVGDHAVPSSVIRDHYGRPEGEPAPPWARTAMMTNRQRRAVDDAVDSFDDDTPLLIYGDEHPDVDRFSPAMVGRLARKGVRVIFVDYLGITPSNGKEETPHINELAQALKRQAGRHGVVVVGLAQVNRDGERGSPDEPPGLWTLKGSTAIRQASSQVWAVHFHYPEGEGDLEPPRMIDGGGVWVKKNRDGVGGVKADLIFHGAAQTWRSREEMNFGQRPIGDDWK